MIRKSSVQDLIAELNVSDEAEDLEAKHISGNQIGRSTFETICALSNEPELQGGSILLGIEKENALFPLYSPVGVKDPDKLSSDISSACASMFNQPIRVDIRPERIKKNIILKIDVPELPKTRKPAYFKKDNLPRGAFRRVGPADIRCTDEDLHTFFNDKTNLSFDSSLVDDASWDDIDLSAIDAYRKSRQDSNPIEDELSWSDQELLYALGAVIQLESSIRITLTGLLLFGKSSSLRRLLPSHRVDYIRVSTKNWFSDPDQRIETLNLRGPMVKVIPRVISAILDDLPKTLDIEGGKSGRRLEVPVLPTRVVREAMVNALMHRNYQVYQPIQVIRYPNRIEIKNPGHSLKSQERFERPGSYLRNPKIAEILHETRFAETKGSGIRVMNAKMQESGFAAPSFSSDRAGDEFIATFLFHHFLQAGDLDWLSQFSKFELTEDQMKALIFVREVGAIDNVTYRNLTSTDTLSASKSLRVLREKELLDRGDGTRMHYVPGEAMLRLDSQPTNNSPSTSKISSQDSGVVLEAPNDKSREMRDLPHVLRSRVLNFQLTRRANPEDARNLVVELCAWRALTIVEIASFLDRNPVYVAQDYVKPLIAEQRIRYKFPEMIHHPKQRYLAPKSV